LLHEARKYNPRIVIFDLGGQYNSVTRAYSGSSVRLGVKDNEFTINPLSLAPTEKNLHFLYTFVCALLEGGGYRMSDDAATEVHRAIKRAYQLPREPLRVGFKKNFHASSSKNKGNGIRWLYHRPTEARAQSH
jgi:type IV secretory pathway VirB4 component